MLRLATLAFALPFLLACSSSSGAPAEPTEEDTYFMRDDDGRVVILRGSNIMSSSKGDPERLPPNFTEEDVERYADLWGFNVVRYLIFWDAIEPSPGEYDPGGWGIWERGPGGELVERSNADIVVRPYPRAVAGIPGRSLMTRTAGRSRAARKRRAAPRPGIKTGKSSKS